MPDWRPEVRRRLAPLGLDPIRMAEITEELSGHLDDKYQELIRRGASPAAAEAGVTAELLTESALAAALVGVERPAPAPRPVLGQGNGGWLSGLVADFQYGIRSLRNAPGLVAVAVGTLGLGIAVTTAIFSVVNAAILKPLPFADPGKLVSFWGTAPEKGLPTFTYPTGFLQVHRSTPGLDGVAYHVSSGATLSGTSRAERIRISWITAGFVELLGRQPLMGRSFTPKDGEPNAPPVILVSHRFWQRRLSGSPDAIGQRVTIDGRPRTLIGIMPPGFDFPYRSEVWIPLEVDPQSLGCWCHDAIGRLNAATTPAQLARDIDRRAYQFWQEREPNGKHDPPDPNRPGTIVRPLATALLGDLRTPMLVVLAAVGVVLLIGCANLANLMLARATARSREIAVRSALGASPARIARQLLIESGLLAAGASVLGLGGAALGIDALSRFVVAKVNYLEAVRIDVAIAGFAVGLGLVTSIICGLGPALAGARTGLAPALREGARGTGDRASRRFSDGFVVAQLSFSLVLLVAAGLLISSFSRLVTQDLGFDPTTVTARVTPSGPAYREGNRFRRLAEEVDERIAAIPGVTAVGATWTAPFGTSNTQNNLRVWGQEPPGNRDYPVASIRGVTPGYFAAVGTPLIEGRPFDRTDREASSAVVIVDQSLARRYWPNGGALGARISIDNDSLRQPIWRTVVGVATNIKHQRLDGPADMYVYLPIAQYGGWSLDLVIRSSLPLEALKPQLESAIGAIDGDLPVYEVRTLQAAVDQSLGPVRLTNLLLGLFAVVSMVMAAIGIYGVMSRGVVARTRELGVRLALGASPVEVRRLVIAGGARLTIGGLVIGLLGALVASRLIRGLLYQAPSFDPVVFSVAAGVLAAVAIAACVIPARRATRIDPLEALRSQ